MRFPAHPNHTPIRRSIDALLSLALAAACGGDGEEISGPPPISVPVASVIVSPATASTTVGGTVQLTAETRAADGTPLPGRAITWSTSDSAVAVPTSAGLVAGIGAGSASISATSEGIEGTATVDVSQPGSPQFQVVATQPADGAATVETGASLSATFNTPADPASLTASSFTLTLEGRPLAAQVTYDPPTLTGVLSGPLLPGRVYGVEVGTGVTDVEGQPLAQPVRWGFATREWQATTIDTGGDEGTSLAIDPSGAVHVSYASLVADFDWDLTYATCASGCTSAANWRIGTADVGDAGFYSSLVIDGQGRVHLSYYDQGNQDLKYATCSGDCTDPANWLQIPIDRDGDAGTYTSLALGPDNSLHLTYHDETNGDLKYATCPAGCASAASWQRITVESADEVGKYNDLAIDRAGRLHVSYHNATNRDLGYATCAAACADPANWHRITVDQSGEVGVFTSIAVGDQGEVHVSYADVGLPDGSGLLQYAECATGCADAGNWQSVTVQLRGVSARSTSLAVDRFGRRHLGYVAANGFAYATCAVSCSNTGNWQSTTVDSESGTGGAGYHSAIVVDGAGRVHATYRDEVFATIKYIE